MARRIFTRDELLAAFRACRRPSWPEEFTDAMNDEFFSRLVHLHALQRAKRIERQAKQTRQQRPARPTLMVPTTQPVFDHKRRAAGEREDD